jgi:hypothetical protein
MLHSFRMRRCSSRSRSGGSRKRRREDLDARAAANHKAEPSEATTAGAARSLTSPGEM